MATEPGGPNNYFLRSGLRAGIVAGFWLADLLWAGLQICCERFLGMQIGLQVFLRLWLQIFCEIGCDVFANLLQTVLVFFSLFCEFVVDCLWTV